MKGFVLDKYFSVIPISANVVLTSQRSYLSQILQTYLLCFAVKMLFTFECLLSYLVVIDVAAKVHPPHILHEDIHSVPLLSSDVQCKHSVSFQQAFEHLCTKPPPHQE